MLEIENICKYHTLISKKKYLYVVDCIMGDVLMGKVSKKNEIIHVILNKMILEVIKKWYDFSSHVKIYNSKHRFFFVYRGFKSSQTIGKNNILPHPIPFSTCMDYNNAIIWTDDEKSYVLKIKITCEIPFTFIGNINEGNEVIISAGKLHVTEIENNILHCNIVPYETYNIMENELKNVHVDFY